MDEDIYPDELYHYGRKGMKWGQHIFGKERPAGGNRKRKSKDVENRFVSGAKSVASKVSASRAKAKEDKRIQKLKKKKISDMTDDELAEYTDRMNRERLANQVRNNARVLDPQNVSKGRSFISSIGRDVIAPTAKNVGRQWLEKTLKDQLGLNNYNNDPLRALRDQAERMGLEDRIAQLNENARRRNNPDPLDNMRRAAEAVRLQNQMEAAAEQMSKRREASQKPRETQDVRDENPSSNSAKVDDISVATGYAYVEQNRQLLNTPIAGLLPAPKDDRYR